LVWWLCVKNEFNSNYYGFGLNIKHTSVKDFISRNDFFKLLTFVSTNLRKKAGCANIDYDVITKDKFIATSFLKSNNISCISNLAIISNSKIIYADGKISDLEQDLLKFQFPIIIKNTVLEYNEGFYKCEKINNVLVINGKTSNYPEFIKLLRQGKWVIQEMIKSNDDICRINNTALNTTRIVTILNGSEPIYLTGFQAFATNNNFTDSWGKGSVYVGINPVNSCLKKQGYFHPNVGTLSYVEKHPDSNVVFEDYKINGLDEAVSICLKAHRLLYFHFAIGWDVAITNKGPMILEANEKPGMNAVQFIDGGLRHSIYSLAAKTNKTMIINGAS